jgi:hypothetical protein
VFASNAEVTLKAVPSEDVALNANINLTCIIDVSSK